MLGCDDGVKVLSCPEHDKEANQLNSEISDFNEGNSDGSKHEVTVRDGRGAF